MTSASYSGVRLAIVGGCQVSGLKQWAARLLPGAQIDAWHINAIPEWAPDKIAPQIAHHDVVISQLSDQGDGGELRISELLSAGRRAVYVPVLIFTGFHPDLAAVVTREGGVARFVHGPLGTLQSAIIAACFVLGVPPERVPRLFNALVFGTLGYFSAYPQAVDAFERIAAENGFDVTGACALWRQSGPFMYTDNHPAIRVLEPFARQALAKLGLDVSGIQSDDPPPDDLAGSIQWPVYPALARRIGVAGSTVFLRQRYGLPSEESRAVPLDAFVVESYAAFMAAPPANEGKVARTAEKLRGLLGAQGAAAD